MVGWINGALHAAPGAFASTCGSVSCFGPGDAAWDAYYANPADTSKWAAFCSGGGGSVAVQAIGVPACGPTGATNISLKGNIYTPGFQCVELTDRYLYVTKGWTAVNANGAGVARGYAAAHSLSTVSNGTVGKAPQVGDVISFSNQSNFSDTGHAAVVYASSVDGSGNGSVSILNQNVSINGATATGATLDLAVNNWNVAKLGFNYVEWLPLGSNAATPSLSVGDVAVTETNSSSSAVFTVSLSAAASNTVSVHYATKNKTAKAPADFTSTSGTLTFTPGQTSKTVTVPVAGDTLFETPETFLLNLTKPTGATIADAQAIGTINNDDPMPTLAIADVSKAEGNSGSSTMTFTVSLSAPSGTATKVKWSTANGTATAGSDYTGASGTVSIPAGATSATFTVTITGDTAKEANETFLAKLSKPTNATIADGQATATITNDD
ncbi:MAG TPA: Calx-beta domain-containing protein [Acidimicrobiales bacterium]|nr:Calx-beta domain-containing protein [Acidimicrobiales bacterium]